ncbi:lysophosphatidic acid receptor 6-like [Callorhinchus milii]|nr:lysophosphatidic acid receptor 6-like [Callorhinchus milii]
MAAAEMGNSTNTSLGVNIFQLVVCTPTFVLGLIINLVALWILCFKVMKCTEPMIYMANLIISDVFLLFSLPFKMDGLWNKDQWTLGGPFCKFVESLYFVNTYGSILLITFIAIDRYIALKQPFMARTCRSPRKAAIICIALWTFVWSASIPNYFVNMDTNNCFIHFDEFWERGVIPMTMEAIFVICTVTMTFCSIQAIRTLRKSISAVDGNANRIIPVRIIFSNWIIYILCFAPYHIAMLLYFLLKQQLISQDYLITLRSILQICQCLSNINCCLDAIYYYLAIKEFMKPKLKSTEETCSTHISQLPKCLYVLSAKLNRK